MRGRVGTAVLIALLLASCGGDRELASWESNPATWPWETAPPVHDSRQQASADGDVPVVLVTVSEAPTPTPTPTPTPEPTETATADPEPSESATSNPPDDPRGDLAQLEAEAVALTNAERTARGCPELRVDDRLHAAALGHSEDMAARNYFDHQSPEGDGPADRAAAEGYDGYRGENIAMGQRTAEQVIDAWMNSPGHRRNILNCQSNDVGIGVADSSRGLYWTQKFGRS